MASILRRPLLRTATSSIPRHLSRQTRRSLSTTPTRFAQPIRASASAERRENAPTESTLVGGRSGLDYHTVEDLQGMSAVDLLAEDGSRADAQMRHFTGQSPCYPFMKNRTVVLIGWVKYSELWVSLAVDR